MLTFSLFFDLYTLLYSLSITQLSDYIVATFAKVSPCISYITSCCVTYVDTNTISAPIYGLVVFVTIHTS